MTTHDTPTQQRDDAYRIATTPGAVIMFGEGRDDYIVPGGIWRRLLNALTRHEQTQGVNEQPTPSTIMPHDSHTPEPTQANESMQAPSVVMGLAHAQPQAQQPAGELASCPFCGGEAELIREGTARQSCQVACTDCGALVEGPSVAAWNRRAAPAEASGGKYSPTVPVNRQMWDQMRARLPQLTADREAALRQVKALRNVLDEAASDLELGIRESFLVAEDLRESISELDAPAAADSGMPASESARPPLTARAIMQCVNGQLASLIVPDPGCQDGWRWSDDAEAELAELCASSATTLNPVEPAPPAGLVAAVRELMEWINGCTLVDNDGLRQSMARVESLLAGADQPGEDAPLRKLWDKANAVRGILIKRKADDELNDEESVLLDALQSMADDYVDELIPRDTSVLEAGEQLAGELNLPDAMRQLREAGGHGWDNVQDVEATIADMRGTDDMPLLPPAPPQPEGEGE